MLRVHSEECTIDRCLQQTQILYQSRLIFTFLHSFVYL